MSSSASAENQTGNQPSAPCPFYLAWRTSAIASAVFCAVVALAILVRDFASQKEDPLNAPTLAALKQQLITSPNDESLKQKIRELDLRVRRDYFTVLRFKQTGAWLLVIGMAVFLYSARKAARLRETPPIPGPASDPTESHLRAAAHARHVAIAAMALFAIASLGLAIPHRSRVPATEAEIEKLLAGGASTETNAAPLPTPAEAAANWPRFLGPTGNAFATNVSIPDAIDPTNKVGVCWRTPVDLFGYSSPVVWGDRVFLTSGDETNRYVLCYDANSGELLWQRLVRDLPGSPQKQPEIPAGTGFAAPSPATDGQRVYAIFGNGDLAAFKFDGTLAWGKNMGVPDNPYGHAQSLLVWRDRLIVPIDQSEAEKNRSKLFMLEGATGKVVWEKTRPVPSSWATPVLIEAGGLTQIITLGGSWVISYNAADGSELWRAECLSGEITPSPIFAADLVFAISPNDKIIAIRPDGRGDVTKTHLAWSYDENIPDIPSPVSNGAFVFVVSTPGVVTCLDAKTGAKAWDHDFELEVNATPAIAKDRIIMAGKKGRVVILQAGAEFKELARFDLGEEIFASPALVADRIYLRTAVALYCIGAPKPNAQATP
ncbi:MAG TPA: PQQ-binding-like beta-propeller repeat protein [Verrucomicrobiota bacterium]|nr:PQQ-binding-like beta-propeller repeat protein [Verrucomicrobiota bacterium]